MSPDVTIDAFFQAPIVQDNWIIKSTNLELVRFGYLWKLYDMVLERGLDPRVPILGPDIA
jgi:hypothetical protein